MTSHLDLAVASHPNPPLSERWHLMRNPPSPREFSLSPGDWRGERRTLADADDAVETLLSTYSQAGQVWLDWLAAELRGGGITPAVLDFDSRLVVAAQAVLDGGDWPAEWRVRYSPEADLVNRMAGLRDRAPELMRRFAATLPSARRQKLEDAWATMDFVDAFRRGWFDRREALQRGDWPDDVAVVQVAGSKGWGAWFSQGSWAGWMPPFADDRVLKVLRESGATGWTSKMIDIRGRDWERRYTHQALFIEGRLPEALFARPVKLPWPAEPAFFERTYVRDVVHELPPGRVLLRGWHGAYASPELSQVLAKARLPGLVLIPMLYESEVPIANRDGD